MHTETLALAGITNPYKTRLQGFFRQAHSWQWLDGLPWLKAIVMTILLGSALLLVLSGAWLLLRLPYQARRRGLRRWHYALSWLVVLPLTLYLLTGIYHFAYKYAKPDTLGLSLQTATPLPGSWQIPELTTEQATLYNSATLVQVGYLLIPKPVSLLSNNIAAANGSATVFPLTINGASYNPCWAAMAGIRWW